MPGGNGTGPMGTGPMTGRGMGVCAGRPASMMYLGGGRFTRGCGMGFGGRGHRNRFFAAVLTDNMVLSDLKQQAQYLQTNLEQINHRIEQLEKE